MTDKLAAEEEARCVVQRIDQCTNCHAPVLYRCHPSGEPYEMFCAASERPLFLIEAGL